MKEILVAMMGLVGTIGVGILGFYQWRKSQDRTIQNPEFESRRKTHELLWSKLEEIHLLLRTLDENIPMYDHLQGRNPIIFNMVKDLNSLFIQNSLYLDDSIQDDIMKYINSMDNLRTLIYVSGDRDVIESWKTTVMQAPQHIKNIRESYEEMEKLRLAVKNKLRNVSS